MTLAKFALYRHAVTLMTEAERTLAAELAHVADAGDADARAAFEAIVHRAIRRERAAATQRHRESLFTRRRPIVRAAAAAQ